MAYPPLSLFAKCICEQVKMQNNPSFNVLCSGGVESETFKLERPMKHNYKSSVSVRKTDIETDSEANPASSSKKKVTDMDKEFPLHNKPHPLRKCRTFRSKLLEEHKAYFKGNNICFRCCASTLHCAKGC